MQEIANVLSNFLHTKARLGGKASVIDSPDQVSLLKELPDFFRQALVKAGRLHEFEIEGSIGNGNMARVPWVGVFNTRVTSSAQEGYYIVLLFSEDMSGCYLSLNQGVTEMEKRYTRRLAMKKMVEAADASVDLLDKHPEAGYGKIDLHSTGDLGRGYEHGAIESFYYRSSELPSRTEFEIHFRALLTNYDKLLKVIGKDLKKIAPITEAEFQDAVLEKASAAGPLELSDQRSEGVAGPVQKLTAGRLTYVRNPTIAARALRMAEFSCELDVTHWTFESRAKSRPYVEAHHLVPMSQQPKYEVSLDVEENIVCLCATCHRLLHFGGQEARNSSIKKLLKKRNKALAARKIEVTGAKLLSFYSRESTMDE